MSPAHIAYPAVSKISIHNADYQLLFEANPLPMFVFDRKSFKFLAVNQAAIKHYGYTATEFRKIRLKDIYRAEDHGQLENRFAISEKVGSQTSQCIHLDKSGNPLDIEMTYQPIGFEGAQACLCICNDITEKKSAERALLQSEAHLKALIENAQEAIWAVDADHRLSFMNNIYKRLHYYHYEVEPYVGMKIYEHFPEKVKELWLARFKKAFDGEKFTLDWHFDIGDFEYEAEVIITPIVNDEDEITGVAYHAKDITQSKQVTQALREQEEQYRSLIQNMTEGVVIVGPDMKLSFANDRFYMITGYSENDLKHGLIEKLFQDHKTLQLLEYNFNRIHNGHDVQIELKIHRKSGDTIWVIVNGSPLYTKGDHFSGALFTLTDITERKLNEEKVRISEIRYRTLIEAINEGVMQVDLNDDIVFVNKRICNMLGYQEDELIGRSSLEIFEDETSRRRIKEHRTLRLTGQSSQYEANIISKTGYVIPVIVNGTPLYSERGELIGTLGTFTDISDIKKSEEKLKRSNQELNTFVYKASHDLRGPLATVIGLADLAPSEVKEKTALEYISKIKSRAARLDNILSELLDNIRIKEEELLFEKLNLQKICNSVLATFSHYQGYEDIRFNVNIDQCLPFYSDRKIVFSLLRNLIDNAIKYRDESKEVSFVNVNIVTDSQKAYISIHDNGIGIMKSAQDKIFDMFYRASLISNGSGLGLYIVKNAVEKLGGTIRFESTEHKGTIFLVELPNNEGTDIV